MRDGSGPPPRWVRLLRRVLPDELADEVLADLRRLWNERREARGPAAADRWYRAQALAALLPSAGHALRRLSGSARQDVAHALRQLRRHPRVGATVALTLSLGIGATTAIFSAVHRVLLEPLPYAAPSELVVVTSARGGSEEELPVSGPDAMDMEREVASLAEVAGFGEPTVAPLTGGDRPEHVLAVPVTWNLFDVLGVEVMAGRGFEADDGVPVAEGEPAPPTSAVVSHAFWRRSLGGDPDAVGRVIRVWGGSTEVVGVLPEGLEVVVPPELDVPPDADVWMALRRDVRDWPREGRWLRTVGRLAGGVPVERVRREVAAFEARQRERHAVHADERTTYRVTPLESAAAAPLRGPLWLLMGAVSLVLLIACANVSGLLLARGAARRSEMAVRASLGGGAGRLARQLVTETAVLAALGAAGGVALAAAGVDVLHALRPDGLERLAGISLDLPVLTFAVVTAAVATGLAGLAPALQAARQPPAGSLTVRGAGREGGRLRSGLVVAEIALSVTLLVGAGLLIRTFGELQRVPLGFEPEGVLTVTATQPGRPAEERRAFEAELLRAARSVPGVREAGIVFPLPMDPVYERTAEYVPEGSEHDPRAWRRAYFRTVDPAYFGVVGLDVLAGRGFTEADEDPDVPVVVVDERLAERAFPDRGAVGASLAVRGMGADTLRARVVGVVEHAPQADHRDTRPTLYFPRPFYRSHEVSLVARVSGDPAAVAPRLRRAAEGVDAGVPVEAAPLEALVDDRLAESRFVLALMQVFAATALLLSALGLYGALSYAVRRRRREMGVRLALGAGGPDLLKDVLARGLILTGAGIGVGLVGALLLGRALRARLFQVGPADPLAVAGAAVLVLAVALGASLLPALSAARIAPARVLEGE